MFYIANEQDLARAGQLIILAATMLEQGTKGTFTQRSDHLSAGEVEAGVVYQEGAVRQVTVNAYERNQEAREACLRH